MLLSLPGLFAVVSVALSFYVRITSNVSECVCAILCQLSAMICPMANVWYTVSVPEVSFFKHLLCNILNDYFVWLFDLRWLRRNYAALHCVKYGSTFKSSLNDILRSFLFQACYFMLVFVWKYCGVKILRCKNEVSRNVRTVKNNWSYEYIGYWTGVLCLNSQYDGVTYAEKLSALWDQPRKYIMHPPQITILHGESFVHFTEFW